MDEDFIKSEEEDFLNKPDADAVLQKSCLNIDLNNGTIKEQKYGKSSVLLETSSKMVVDKQGLIPFGKFVF